MKPLLAFHSDVKVKKLYLAQLKAHRLADQIVKDHYWESGSGTGCGIGCTVHSSDHGQYEILLGIPKFLAYLEDVIFECLPNKEAMKWPENFLSAIPIGADLSDVTLKFLLWNLKQTLQYANYVAHPAIEKIIELYTQKVIGNNSTEKTWKIAEFSAMLSAYDYNTEKCPKSAEWYAIWSAVHAVDIYTAMIDKCTIRSIKYSIVYSVEAANYSMKNTENIMYSNQAKELLRLLTDAPVIKVN